MKIGVISDLHLGYRQYGLKEREEDFYFEYQNVINQLVYDENVDLIINCGDTFDSANPSPKAIGQFANGLDVLREAGVKMLNVVGNHTMLQVKDHFPADNLFLDDFEYELLDENIFFIDQDASVFIAGVPFHTMTKGDAFLDKVSFLNDKAKESKCKVTILCIHQAIMPFCGSFGGEFDVNDLMVDNFSLIFCGHIHHKEKFGNFYQVGSLERSSMTEFVDYEENGKGYSIVEIDDGDVSVRDVDVVLKRKFLHFLVSDFESIDSLKVCFHNLIDTCDVAPVVCIEGDVSEDQYYDLVDFKKAIDKMVVFCKLKISLIPDGCVCNDVDTSFDDLTVEGSFQRYFDSHDVIEPHRNLTLDIYNTIKYDDESSKVHLNDLVDNYFELNYNIDDFKDMEKELKDVIADYTKFFDNLGRNIYENKTKNST